MTPREVCLLLWELRLSPFLASQSAIEIAGPALNPCVLVRPLVFNLQALRHGFRRANQVFANDPTLDHAFRKPLSVNCLGRPKPEDVTAPLNWNVRIFLVTHLYQFAYGCVPRCAR
jgi:hypothetical protein